MGCGGGTSIDFSNIPKRFRLVDVSTTATRLLLTDGATNAFVPVRAAKQIKVNNMLKAMRMFTFSKLVEEIYDLCNVGYTSNEIYLQNCFVVRHPYIIW